jgi:hypothetical protein
VEFPSRSRGKTGKAETQVTRPDLAGCETDVAPISHSGNSDPRSVNSIKIAGVRKAIQEGSCYLRPTLAVY